MEKVIYDFPFLMIAKERERCRCFKGTPSVYSPASTKNFYKKIRNYILEHYSDYEKNRVDYNCKMTITYGILPSNNIADLDNHLKMIDSLSKDSGRKENTGFLGIWKDDDVVKAIDARFKYVNHPDEEFTRIELERYDPYE